MKKQIIIAVLLFASVVGLTLYTPQQSFAQELDVTEPPTDETFDMLNPLTIGESEYKEELSTPGGIVSRVLVFAFPLAGLILFVMLVWGGFEILVGAAGSKSLDAGKQRVTAAIVGFLLLFSSYWLMQIVEYVFGLKVL